MPLTVEDRLEVILAGSQTMAVGEQKDRFVPSVRCKSMEQAGSLLEREKLDRVRSHRGHRAILNSTASARNNSFEQLIMTFQNGSLPKETNSARGAESSL